MDAGYLLMTPEQELRKRDEEIERLRKELEFLEMEKRVLEERYAVLNLKASAEKKQADIAYSVGMLKMDWLQAAKNIEALKDSPDEDLRNSMCIDFANDLRPKAFADIENDPDSVVVVKAIAYETFFRACVTSMQNREVKIKIGMRDRFASDLEKGKEVKREKERVKIEKEKSNDPRERMIQSMLVLGMDRESAEKQADIMFNAAKAITK